MESDVLFTEIEPKLTASLRHVRVAEQYMRLTAHEAVGIDDVARHAGVTMRGIQYAFRWHRQTTPLAVLNRIRLEGFRSALQSGRPEKVSEVPGAGVPVISAVWPGNIAPPFTKRRLKRF